MFTRQEIEEHFAERCADTEFRGQDLVELHKILKEQQYCLSPAYTGMCFRNGQISISGVYLEDYAPPYEIMAEIYMTFSNFHLKCAFKRIRRLLNYVVLENDDFLVDISRHGTVLLSRIINQ